MRDTHHAGPLVIIAALLWVLAWAERSPALAVIVAVLPRGGAGRSATFDDGGLAGGDDRGGEPEPGARCACSA